MARPGSIQYEGRVDGQPLLWIDAVKAVKCRLEDMGLLKPFAFGLLKVLLGTGLRNMLKFLRHEDIQLFYGALRDEARALEGACADRIAVNICFVCLRNNCACKLVNKFSVWLTQVYLNGLAVRFDHNVFKNRKSGPLTLDARISFYRVLNIFSCDRGSVAE